MLLILWGRPLACAGLPAPLACSRYVARRPGRPPQPKGLPPKKHNQSAMFDLAREISKTQ
jgi:hypothetical protein